MERIVNKFMDELGVQLLQKDVSIELSDEAVKYLAEEGFDPLMGARPLGRVIKEKIKQPISEEILFGKLEHGGVVHVGHNEESDELTFDYEGREPTPEDESTDPKAPEVKADLLN